MGQFTFSGGGGGGGGSGVDVQDEGIAILTPALTLNFAGAGVTATDAGGGVALITIPGGGGGAVSSVFTRTGAVVAVAGDYTASQVTNVPAGNIGATDVQAAINELDAEKAGLALANIFTQAQTINFTSVAPPTPFSVNEVRLIGDTGNNPAYWIDTFAGAAVFAGRRANGTPAAPSAVTIGQALASVRAYGYGATAYSAGQRASVTLGASETWTDAAQGARIIFATTPDLGVAQVSRWLVENDGSFIYNGGALTGASTVNTLGYWHTGVEVIDANRIFRPRSYTVGTLPSVTTTGIIHCSDLGGGPGLLQSDGTGWNRGKEEGTITIGTDAGHTFTWDRLADAPVTRGNATLTAIRTVTLSTTGCRNGDRAQFVRLGGGAFNWNIAGGTTFSLTAADQYCVFEFDGTTWNVIEAGQISVASGGGGVDVEDEGSLVLAAATTLNFVGAGVTATNAGGGQVDVTIPGGGGGSGMSIGVYVGLSNSSYF